MVWRLVLYALGIALVASTVVPLWALGGEMYYLVRHGQQVPGSFAWDGLFVVWGAAFVGAMVAVFLTIWVMARVG